MLRSLIQRKALAFLFLCLSTTAFSAVEQKDTIASALSLELHHSLRWQALLHHENGKQHLTDTRFLLSHDDFSLKNELVATIEQFFQPNTQDKHAICRFPARFLWIKQQLNLSNRDFPTTQCHDFEAFQRNAPASQIKLIFASENVNSPSSMMGHAFLMISGPNRKGALIEHAVSYYTVIDSMNLLKVFYDSLVTGKQGLFALTPYTKIKIKYAISEKRNLWEYDLNLSEIEKKLIHYHIWELKNIDSKYFFAQYNCATVTYFLIASGKPDILNYSQIWLTPTDIVKAIYDHAIVSKTTLIPSNRWKIKMLSKNLSSALQDQVQLFTHNPINTDFFSTLEYSERVFAVELAETYAEHLYIDKDIDQEQYRALNNTTNTLKNDSWPNIDISSYKSPLNTPGDTLISTGLGQDDQGTFISVEILPTAHRLIDDNRQYMAENELRIADIKLKYFPQDKTLTLDTFQLYSAFSLNPRDQFTGGISGGWRLGIEPHLDAQLSPHRAFNLSGSIGMSTHLTTDILGYALMGGGYGFADHQHYVYSEPEIGLVVNEVFDMKSILRVSWVSNQLGSGRTFMKSSLTQSFYLDKQNALFLSIEQTQGDKASKNTVELSYAYYF